MALFKASNASGIDNKLVPGGGDNVQWAIIDVMFAGLCGTSTRFGLQWDIIEGINMEPGRPGTDTSTTDSVLLAFISILSQRNSKGSNVSPPFS